MIKCPFCHTMNEDGALFCETCKSDLTGVPSEGVGHAPPPIIPAVPVMAEPVMAEAVLAEAVPVMAEAVPMMAEAVPYMAEAVPVMAEAVPLSAEPVHVIAEVVPLEAEPVEPYPAVPIPVPLVSEAPPAPPPPAPPPIPVPAPAPAAFAPPPPPPPAPPPPAPPPVAAAHAPAPAGEGGSVLPPGSQPRLLVLRGQKRNVEYPIYEGLNYLGRADDKPVDIDLEDQEPPDRVWCSRQHAVISFEDSQVFIEDLNSANGTYVNRTRVYPGTRKPLALNDVVQIGNVQMKLLA